MRILAALLASTIFLMACSGGGSGERPTEADITARMKAVWEEPATSFKARSSIVVNNITFGESEESNYAMQLEGVPKGSTVTHAKIDFSHTTHYDDPRTVRRIMTAWVYRDQFKQWEVMNVGTTYPDGL